MNTLPARARSGGYTYVGVMILLGVLSMGAALTLEVSDTASRRSAEAELLAVGKSYERAFASYYRQSPGMGRRFPDRLEDLVRDPRFPGVRRHLRQVYRDPLNGGEWGTVPAPGGGIMGVYSKAEGVPFREAPVSMAMAPVASASAVSLDAPKSYAEWRFGYDPNNDVMNRNNVIRPTPMPTRVDGQMPR